MTVGTPSDYYEMEDSLKKKLVCSFGKQEPRKVADPKITALYSHAFR
jgi:hypothetical protein